MIEAHDNFAQEGQTEVGSTIEYYSFTRGGESGKVSLDKLAFEL